MKLTEKLLIIQGAEFRVDKDGKNRHFKSSYVTLDNLLSVLLPIATENKIAITHYMMEGKLVTSVINTEVEDDMIVSEFPITQEDPQKIGSAITYAKRYNLGAIFNIITEIDDDGDFASKPKEAPKTKTVDTPNGGTKEAYYQSHDEHCPECGTANPTKTGTTKTGNPYELADCGACAIRYFVNRK